MFLALCRSHNLIKESEKHYKEIAEVLKVRPPSTLPHHLLLPCSQVNTASPCTVLPPCLSCVRMTSATWCWAVCLRRGSSSCRTTSMTCTRRGLPLPPPPPTPQRDYASPNTILTTADSGTILWYTYLPVQHFHSYHIHTVHTY